jgi:hypothetical protein
MSPLGCLLGPIRLGVTIVFGIVFLVTFAMFLLFNAVDSDVLDASFYIDPLDGNNVYARFYDQVLVDPEFGEIKDKFLGEIQVPMEDIVQVARRIVTPEYLQSEVEQSIETTVAYLRSETDSLELFINLGPPLENAKKELLSFINTEIKHLQLKPLETEMELEVFIEEMFRDLEAGIIPSEIPSFSADINLVRIYEEILEDLRSDPSMPKDITDALANPDTDRGIRASLANSDLGGAIKEASIGLATPLIDDALDELRKKLVTADRITCENILGTLALEPCTHFDVLQIIAEGADQTKEELQSELGDIRGVVDRVRTIGSWAPFLIMLVAMGVISLFMLPRLSRVLRINGIVLAGTGSIFLVAGLLLGSVVPDRIDSSVAVGVERTGAPASVSTISADVLDDMVKDLFTGIVTPSGGLLVIGGLLFVISFFLKSVPFLLLGVQRRL